MNDQELLRYNRHVLLPQIDIEGQEKICSAKVLILGLGGLGSPVAIYLAASGVGNLVLADDDIVDESNLQRQIIHTEATLGQKKISSAAQHIRNLNSHCRVSTIEARMTEELLRQHIAAVNVVVDCSDNFETRNLVNRVCLHHKIPLVSGAAIRLEAQLTVFDFHQKSSPCYACLFESTGDDTLSCSENGVLSPLVGIVGSAQALETLKLIVGFGETLSGILALYDGMSSKWRYLSYRKNSHCKVCG